MSEICHRCRGTGEEPDWRKFGVFVRNVRESSGIGLRQFAQMVGCSPTYISDLEHGKRSWQGIIARKILRKLGLPVGLLDKGIS